MNLAAIMVLTGKSQATIYTWMKKRGFPPSDNGEWDEAAVRDWWRDNRDRVGRWPKERGHEGRR